MSQTPEGRVKQKIAKMLQEIKAWYFFPAMGQFGRAGIPDIIGHYRGRFFAIEVKAGSGQPTPLQSAEMMKIIKAGAFVMFINEENYEETTGNFLRWTVNIDREEE